jgi:PAS domain S-box-containing protein
MWLIKKHVNKFKMNDQLKSVEELSAELNELQKKYDSLKALYSKDITEQQGTEKAFRESEEKFRSITENSADAIFITDQQGKYVYTNKAVSVMLGYTPEEMKTKTFADISPPDKLDEYFELFNLILKGGKGFDEIQLLKKDGSYLSTDLNVVLLPDGLVYGSCRDITDRKQAEKKMEEIVASLRNSQEIAMMGSWELDLATKKAKWSENCFVIYGLKPYEIEPTFAYFRSRIHPDDQHIIDESFDSILLNKEPRITELRILFPDKTIRWFQNRLIPVFVDDKLVAQKE